MKKSLHILTALLLAAVLAFSGLPALAEESGSIPQAALDETLEATVATNEDIEWGKGLFTFTPAATGVYSLSVLFGSGAEDCRYFYMDLNTESGLMELESRTFLGTVLMDEVPGRTDYFILQGGTEYRCFVFCDSMADSLDLSLTLSYFGQTIGNLGPAVHAQYIEDLDKEGNPYPSILVISGVGSTWDYVDAPVNWCSFWLNQGHYFDHLNFDYTVVMEGVTRIGMGIFDSDQIRTHFGTIDMPTTLKSLGKGTFKFAGPHDADGILFTGDAPFIHDEALLCTNPDQLNSSNPIHVYHILNNPTYTKSVRKTFGGCWAWHEKEHSYDCNGDGSINMKDVSLLFRYVSGEAVPQYVRGTGDLDGDQKITLKDVPSFYNYLTVRY